MLILQSFSIEEHEEQPRRESVCWHCHQTPYPFYKISLGMEKSTMLLLQLLPPFRLPKAADAAAPTSNSVPEGHCSSGPTSRIFSDQALMPATTIHTPPVRAGRRERIFRNHLKRILGTPRFNTTLIPRY